MADVNPLVLIAYLEAQLEAIAAVLTRLKEQLADDPR
jgi:hypothetical protein